MSMEQSAVLFLSDVGEWPPQSSNPAALVYPTLSTVGSIMTLAGSKMSSQWDVNIQNARNLALDVMTIER